MMTMALAAAELPQSQTISIDADSGVQEIDRGTTRLEGNVRIARGDLLVQADRGQAHHPDGNYERIELFGEPATWQARTEDGGEAKGHADQLIYDLLANRIIMTGDAYIRDARGTFSGQRLVYDLDSQRTEGEGGIQMIIEPDAIDPAPANNAEQAGPDRPAADKPAETDPPPG